MTDASLDPWENWTARYHQQLAASRNALLAKKTALIQVLKPLGIDTAIITYDGEGASGQIEDICATNSENLPIHVDQISITGSAGDEADTKTSGATLRSYLEDFAWSVLYAYHDGFENNEGGYGTLTIEVNAGTVTLDHNDRVIDVNTTLTEI